MGGSDLPPSGAYRPAMAGIPYLAEPPNPERAVRHCARALVELAAPTTVAIVVQPARDEIGGKDVLIKTWDRPLSDEKC